MKNILKFDQCGNMDFWQDYDGIRSVCGTAGDVTEHVSDEAAEQHHYVSVEGHDFIVLATDDYFFWKT